MVAHYRDDTTRHSTVTPSAARLAFILIELTQGMEPAEDGNYSVDRAAVVAKWTEVFSWHAKEGSGATVRARITKGITPLQGAKIIVATGGADGVIKVLDRKSLETAANKRPAFETADGRTRGDLRRMTAPVDQAKS